MIDISELREMFTCLEGCCLHSPLWRLEDVAVVLCAIWQGYGDRWDDIPKYGTDSRSVWVVRLKDSAYGLLCESEDYTGHGCMCNSYTAKYPSLPDLMQGLSEGERGAVALRLMKDVDPGFVFLSERVAA